MKIIYLAAGHAKLDIDKVTYNDLFIKRDLQCDMLEVDLSKYDIIIATPPCNYYSRANYRRDISEYSLNTKHLLPGIIEKLQYSNKPFIVENVRNPKLLKHIIDNFNGFYYEYGRHTYFTNIPFNMSNFIFEKSTNHNKLSKKQRQGSGNVKEVIEYWLDVCMKTLS